MNEDLSVTADGRPARFSAGSLKIDSPKIVGLLALAAIAFLFFMGLGFRSVNP